MFNTSILQRCSTGCSVPLGARLLSEPNPRAVLRRSTAGWQPHGAALFAFYGLAVPAAIISAARPRIWPAGRAQRVWDWQCLVLSPGCSPASGARSSRGRARHGTRGAAVLKYRVLTSPFLCRDFQRVSHLPPSGVLDAPTLRQMGRPRCGTGDGESWGHPAALRHRRSAQHGEHRHPAGPGLGESSWRVVVERGARTTRGEAQQFGRQSLMALRCLQVTLTPVAQCRGSGLTQGKGT